MYIADTCKHAVVIPTHYARDHETNLSESIQRLLRVPDLDTFLVDKKGFFGDFLKRLFGTLERAFQDGCDAALLDVHKTLHRLYEEEVGPVKPGARQNQYHPFIIRVRNEIERAWERSELQRMDLTPDDVPTEPSAFSDFLRDCCARHKLTNHALFDFLEQEADRGAMIDFFVHEGSVALRFCDLIVLAMVGADDEIRRELADNFWDEVGSGNYQNRHTELYIRLLRYVGKEPPSTVSLLDSCMENLDWRGFAGYNMYFYLALHRRNYFRSVGCLGVAEMMDPAQYEKIVRGCHRVGLTDDHQLAYYVDHVIIDKEHGDGWFDHVMTPLARKYPEATYDMAVGAILRMNTGADYYDSLLKSMPDVATRRVDETEPLQRRAA